MHGEAKCQLSCPILGVLERAYRLDTPNLFPSRAVPASAVRRGNPTPQLPVLLADWQRLAETGVSQSLSLSDLGCGPRLPRNVP